LLPSSIINGRVFASSFPKTTPVRQQSRVLQSGARPQVSWRNQSTSSHLPRPVTYKYNFDVRNLAVKGRDAGASASILSSDKACEWIGESLSAFRAENQQYCASEAIDDLKSATQAILREAFHSQKDEPDNVDRMRKEIASRLQGLSPIEIGRLRDILQENHFSTKMYHTTIDERALKYGSVPLNCVPVTPYASRFGTEDFFDLLQELSHLHWKPSRSDL